MVTCVYNEAYFQRSIRFGFPVARSEVFDIRISIVVFYLEKKSLYKSAFQFKIQCDEFFRI